LLSLRDSRLEEEGAVQVFCGQTTPVCASASKAKSSLLSQLSGLENVLFNDFIDDELDSEDVSEQKASASLPDSVPIESEIERAAREQDEIVALDAVGDYEADATVMLEDVPQDIVIKTLKVWCACVSVLVFVYVCVCLQEMHIAHKFESGWDVGVIKARFLFCCFIEVTYDCSEVC